MTRFALICSFLVSFGINLYLAFPALSPFRDAGDLAIAASTLGVAHPPGYPFYVLLGHSVQNLVPWANPAYRLNLTSALCGGGTILFLFLILLRYVHFAAAVMGTSLALLLPASLSQNGLSEIYSLNALFSVALLWLALAGSERSPSARLRGWGLVGFLLGLGAGNHQTLLLAVPALLVIGIRRPGRDLFRLRFLGPALLFFVMGFSIYLFLPWRVWAGGGYSWGEPNTWTGFWQMLSRADYGAGTLSTRYSTASSQEGVAFWFQQWYWQWGLPGVLLVFLGAVVAFKKENRLSWGGPVLMLWAFTGPFFAFLARMKAGELSQAILQPMFVVPSLAAALAIGFFMDVCVRSRRLAAVFAAVLWLSFVGLKGFPALLGQNQRGNFLAMDYGQNLLRTLPNRTALLMVSDAGIFCVGYRQSVSGERADIPVLIDADLPWRWRRFRRRFPGLFAEGQPDGGKNFVRFQSQRVPIFTEGMQSGLLDVLCPVGLAARVQWPARSALCLDEIKNDLWIWDVYTRRVPSPLVLLSDYYSRTILKTVSSGAFNAGLLMSQAGPRRAELNDAVKRAYARALFWNPDRLLRWSDVF